MPRYGLSLFTEYTVRMRLTRGNRWQDSMGIRTIDNTPNTGRVNGMSSNLLLVVLLYK